jgi:hypothetical protein
MTLRSLQHIERAPTRDFFVGNAYAHAAQENGCFKKIEVYERAMQVDHRAQGWPDDPRRFSLSC